MIVLNLVLIGLVITLEPLPLTAFILILSSKGGVRKGAAFIFGWLLSLAIVIAFTVLVTGNNPPKPSTAPSLAALAAKLAIGVGLTALAERREVPTIDAAGIDTQHVVEPLWWKRNRRMAVHHHRLAAIVIGPRIAAR